MVNPLCACGYNIGEREITKAKRVIIAFKSQFTTTTHAVNGKGILLRNIISINTHIELL